MTGRQLLRRPGYDIDIEKVLAACAEYGVAVEINANPWRLDLDWRWHETALRHGCMMSINPDAHSTREIDLTHWGVEMARKGGVPKERVLNCLNREEFAEYLANRRDEPRGSRAARPHSSGHGLYCQSKKASEAGNYAAFARCFFRRRPFGFLCEPAAQKGKDSRFLRFEALHIAAQFAFGFFFQLKHELAVHVRIQNFRMHVALRQMVGVLPSLPATFSMAVRRCRFACAALSKLSSSLRAIAARTVPAQVRSPSP